MTTRGAVAAAISAVAALSLGAAPAADAARFGVGLVEGADRSVVVQRIIARGGSAVVDLAPIRAITVSARDQRMLEGVPGVRYVELLHARRVAFVPNDPFLVRQWYAASNRSFDSWPELPPLAPVRIALIDSGVDRTHPELRGRIVASKSFVKGPAVDTEGHGTFVAGLIAARTNDGIGIAGLAPPAELLVAKVVGQQNSIPVEAEAKAIRWAVANGARIINMSLGGLRDPRNPARDTYSQLEADAVAYAVQKGVLVVAAVGNSDNAPSQPWPYASWPSALPHVLGVSALGRRGGSPRFSNRDPLHNDIAAPGEGILSLLPLALTAAHSDCVEQGYSSCGSEEFRSAEGTSFAAPQVTAAAAMVLATMPSLAADQVLGLLTKSAVDAKPSTGCAPCSPGHDPYTGAGRLDQAAALALLGTAIPDRDRFEPNDNGASAYPLYGAGRRVVATLDYWNDPTDAFRVYLRRGERLVARVEATRGRPALSLWRPGTLIMDPASTIARRLMARPPGAALGYTAPAAGWYVLQVGLTRHGAGAYQLTVSKRR